MIDVFILLALIFLNGLFVMSEIALVSARKSRLENMASKGDAPSRVALDLANNPDLFLSAAQIGITFDCHLNGCIFRRTVWSAPYTGIRKIRPAAALCQYYFHHCHCYHRYFFIHHFRGTDTQKTGAAEIGTYRPRSGKAHDNVCYVHASHCMAAEQNQQFILYHL